MPHYKPLSIRVIHLPPKFMNLYQLFFGGEVRLVKHVCKISERLNEFKRWLPSPKVSQNLMKNWNNLIIKIVHHRFYLIKNSSDTFLKNILQYIKFIFIHEALTSSDHISRTRHRTEKICPSKESSCYALQILFYKYSLNS